MNALCCTGPVVKPVHNQIRGSDDTLLFFRVCCGSADHQIHTEFVCKINRSGDDFDLYFFENNRGEKSVKVINVESTFSTKGPFASDLSFTLFHSASSRNDFQFVSAASRVG
jgi:hypothetical protein